MADRETIALYDARAGDYARLTGKEDGPSETLRSFIAKVRAGGRVLDIGCGPGVSAGHMAAAGLIVDAWDASEGMIALAATHTGVTARLAGFDDLEAENAYDAIWANFSLLHAPRADMPRHLAAIHRALRDGGLFHMAVKAGQGSARDSLGRLYTYYTEEELSGLLVAHGFSHEAFQHGEDPGLDGVVAPWISVTARA